MRIKLLTSWAGEEFSYRYGEVVDLPEEIAQAQVEAGNAEMVAVAEVQSPSEEPKKKAK